MMTKQQIQEMLSIFTIREDKEWLSGDIWYIVEISVDYYNYFKDLDADKMQEEYEFYHKCFKALGERRFWKKDLADKALSEIREYERIYKKHQ